LDSFEDEKEFESGPQEKDFSVLVFMVNKSVEAEELII
jgi:hypothetical protein